MSDYKAGDLVRLTKGEDIIQGRVIDPVCDGFAHLVLDTQLERLLDEREWTLEVIERAKAPLPTEPGVYEDDNGCVWVLDMAGWHSVTDCGGYFFPGEYNNPEDYTPFTRLVREAV